MLGLFLVGNWVVLRAAAAFNQEANNHGGAIMTCSGLYMKSTLI
jgi:hypothetical protein